MKKKLSWIVVAVLLVGLIGGAGVLYDKYSSEVETERLVAEESVPEETPVEEPEPEVTAPEEPSEEEPALVMAPDFTVYDAEGNAVNLSDYIGKPTVINFWASWCGICEMEMPDFEAKYKELGSEVNFLMVNMTDGFEESLESAKAFLEETGYSFPVYFDTDMDAAMTYGVNSLPATYFIDAEGHAIVMAQGMIDAEILQQGIDMVSK